MGIRIIEVNHGTDDENFYQIKDFPLGTLYGTFKGTVNPASEILVKSWEDIT